MSTTITETCGPKVELGRYETAECGERENVAETHGGSGEGCCSLRLAETMREVGTPCSPA